MPPWTVVTVVQEESRSAEEYWSRLAVVGRNEPELRCESKTSLQRSYQLDLKVSYLSFMVAFKVNQKVFTLPGDKSKLPSGTAMSRASKVARPRSTRKLIAFFTRSPSICLSCWSSESLCESPQPAINGTWMKAAVPLFEGRCARTSSLHAGSKENIMPPHRNAYYETTAGKARQKRDSKETKWIQAYEERLLL